MSMAQGADFNWLAAVVDADGRALANAVLLDHLEGLVPEAVLDAEGGCTLRFPEGFTKRATELHRALGVAAVETGGETGPRRAPVAARVAATLAGPCTILTVDRSGRIAEHPGQFAAGGSAVTLSAARRSGQVLAGAPVLLDGGIVAVTRAANAGDGVEVVNLGELFAALSPSEPAQAASKGPSAQAADVPAPPLPFSGSTRTAYGLAVAIGSTRPGGLPPTDPGILLLGLLAGGRGPLADEAVPRSLYDLLAEPRDDRLAAGLSAAHAPVDLLTLAPADVTAEWALAGSEDVLAAAELAARAAGLQVVAVREYATAVVAADVDADVLEALGVTAEQLRACVAAAVAAPSDVVLAGPFASDQLAAGEEPGDELGTKAYATMLATLVAKEGTPMPISIGLFGEWGSGKSYFMELLRREVNRLSGLGEPYLSDIVQLTFNAWHYSDTNLWASLGAEFFEQLLGPQADPVKARRSVLRKELAENQELARELTAAQVAAVAKAGELRQQLDAADREREAKAHEWDARVLKRVAQGIAEDERLRSELAAIGRDLGVRDDVERVVGFARDVAGAKSDAAAIGQVLLHRRWRWTFLAVLVATLATAGAVAVGDEVADWLRGGALTAVAAAVATAGHGLAAARRALAPLREAAAEARAVEEAMRAAPSGKEEQQLADALREQEARAAVLEAQLADTVARAAAIDRELGDLHPGRQLYRFIAERVSSADYRGQLGIVSTVRHDFEELSRLMKEKWPNEPPAEGVTPIQRIVLYIDDLDRCEPHQVVAVLQAVHLLMAMDLFVVVVGVDPRWLLRSLRRQYRGVLGASAGADGFWATTPQNYLEKIFQIPFVLPGMGRGGFDRLMRSLARPQSRTATGDGRAAADGDGGSGAVSGEASSRGGDGGDAGDDAEPDSRLRFSPSSEVRAVTAGAGPTGTPARPPAPAARELTEHELAFLAHLADLVNTPRAAKRLFNIYGLLRSTSDVWPGSSFLGSDAAPGEFEAVAQLLAILTARPDLLGLLMWGRRADGSVERRALCRSPAPGTTWAGFVERLQPRQSESGGWENDVADALTADEVAGWQEFVTVLRRVQDHVRLTALEPYRQWAPRIARFSFVLSAFADDEPDPPEAARGATAVPSNVG